MVNCIPAGLRPSSPALEPGARPYSLNSETSILGREGCSAALWVSYGMLLTHFHLSLLSMSPFYRILGVGPSIPWR